MLRLDLTIKYHYLRYIHNNTTLKLYYYEKQLIFTFILKMVSKQDVERYLKELKVKTEDFGILFLDDRGINQQTLHDLEISPAKRKEIIANLRTEDFSEGPLEEKMRGILPMWVFGKEVKQKEVYIKISMGLENKSAVCISFHVADHPMNYPYKK
jgi:hypothetical protein